MKPKTLYQTEIPVTSRGLAYFDDCAGRIGKFHKTGMRNIYSILITYGVKGEKGKKKTFQMDYGNFQPAISRFYLEAQQDKWPTKLRLDEIRLVVSTYKGTKKLFEDVLRVVDYEDKRKRQQRREEFIRQLDRERLGY